MGLPQSLFGFHSSIQPKGPHDQQQEWLRKLRGDEQSGDSQKSEDLRQRQTKQANEEKLP